MINEVIKIGEKIYQLCKSSASLNLHIIDLLDTDKKDECDFYLHNNSIGASGYNKGNGSFDKCICKRIINDSDKDLTDVVMFDTNYEYFFWQNDGKSVSSISIPKHSLTKICIFDFIDINDIYLGFSNNFGINFHYSPIK